MKQQNTSKMVATKLLQIVTWYDVTLETIEKHCNVNELCIHGLQRNACHQFTPIVSENSTYALSVHVQYCILTPKYKHAHKQCTYPEALNSTSTAIMHCILSEHKAGPIT